MYNTHKPRKPLSILQVNVGRGATPHEIALTIANDSLIDIILIQEPYVFTDHSRKITKLHPMYETFSPSDDWTARPRTMSYVRKGTGICTAQLRPTPSRDLVFLQLQAHSLPTLTVINVYNAPAGSDGAGEALQSLLTLPHSYTRTVFIAGDFNLHHSRWDPNTVYPPSRADGLIEWLDKNSVVYTSEKGVPTHKQGNVLDLAFLSSNLTAITSVAEHLDVTSDHTPLLTSVNWDPQAHQPPKRLRIDTLDIELFTALLQPNLCALPRLTGLSTTEDLDNAASGLTEAVSRAFNGSAKRSLGQNTGYPWWDESCKAAAYRHRSARSDATARILRNTVRKAKRQYWRDRLDSVKDITDVYKMT